MEKIVLLRRKNFSEIINDSIQFTIKNFGKYATAFLYFVAPFMLAMMALIFTGVNSFGKIFSLQHTERYFGDHSGSNMGIFANVFLLFGIAMLLGVVIFLIMELLAYEYMLLYEKAADPANITMSDLWESIKRDFLFMLSSYLGLFGISFLFLVVNIALIALAFTASKIFGAVLIFAAYIFWIYLIVPLRNFPIIRLRERLGITASIRRCFQLNKGNWWRTFGVLFIIGLIVGAIQSFCVMPLYFAVIIFSVHDILQSPGNPSTLILRIYGIIMPVFMALSFFFAGVSIFASCINYYSLVEQTDNTSLLSEIEQIGEKPEGPAAGQEGTY